MANDMQRLFLWWGINGFICIAAVRTVKSIIAHLNTESPHLVVTFANLDSHADKRCWAAHP
jgi:hypothetical protein